MCEKQSGTSGYDFLTHLRLQLASPWPTLKCTEGATVVLAVMGRKVCLSLLTLGSRQGHDLFRL